MNTATDFDTFLDQAWTDHADDAAGVAARIDAQGLGFVTAAAQAPALAQLAHHVWGEHLGQWQAGLDWFAQIDAHPLLDDAGRAAVVRCSASLRLSAGDSGALDGLVGSDRIRVAAMAAANLGPRDAARAAALLAQAQTEAEASKLPASDPMNRAIAANANNLAGTLEEKADRSADERALMIAAAQTARRYWAIAGTWLETERAEYRLAKTWVQAGDLDQARRHAQECLAIVKANDGAALERFFGWEALGVVERAAGNAAGHQQALAQVREAFEGLDEGDRGWCRASLDRLAAALTA